LAKAELKTKQTEQSVAEFLGSVSDDKKRQASWKILELMQAATQAEPKMWGEGIIGFGQYHYKHASGREGDWFLTGFSPRKQNLTLYIMTGFDQYETLLGKLGKYKTGKACLYINKLEDIDLEVLKELIEKSVDHMTK
jgi:hypothetical protein